MCGITEKAVLINEKVEIREMLKIAFTADHTLVDGAPAYTLSFKTDRINRKRLLPKRIINGWTAHSI